MPARAVLLSPELEAAVLHAILRGVTGVDVVRPEELSKPGRTVLQTTEVLRAQGIVPPFDSATVALAAVEVLGADARSVRECLRAVDAAASATGLVEILHAVRDKQLLVDVINESARQLSHGGLDVGQLAHLLRERAPRPATDARPVGELLAEGLPPAPEGLPLRTLPALGEASGGILGVWAVAGAPGVGKSTLAWQIAIDVGRVVPVLYYDFENGFAVMVHRMSQAVNHDLAKLRRLTRAVYFRDSMRTLERDLAAIAPPALLVVDSVQKLPANIEFRRSGLDRWVHRLEGLKRHGYSVVLVSEVGRASYESEPHVAAYKETGEIEYAADFGVQVIEPVPGSGTVELHVVKNRHRPFRGCAAVLERAHAWWFVERSPSASPTNEEELD